MLSVGMIFTIYIFSMNANYVLSLCGSAQGKTCCAGSYWDKAMMSCEKCPLGYQGIDCLEICRFPTYGKNCQLICNCSSDRCDHRSGCKNQNDGTHYVSSQWQNSTFFKVFYTTPISTKRTSKQQYILYILYITSAFVGVFAVSLCILVGIHFHRQCKQKLTVP